MEMFDWVALIDPREMSVKYLWKQIIPFTYEFCYTWTVKFSIHQQIFFKTLIEKLKFRSATKFYKKSKHLQKLLNSMKEFKDVKKMIKLKEIKEEYEDKHK